MSLVEYRPVVGFPGYRVGDDGSVWSAWTSRSRGVGRGTESFIGATWRKLAQGTEKKTGYKCVRLARGGRKVNMRVHVLVLAAFAGPKPEGKMACHEDDDPANNARGNLRWDFPEGNAADAVRNGRTLAGEKNHGAKIKAAGVFDIRKRFAAGEDAEAIATDHGLSSCHVFSIARGRSWASLSTGHEAGCLLRCRRKRTRDT